MDLSQYDFKRSLIAGGVFALSAFIAVLLFFIIFSNIPSKDFQSFSISATLPAFLFGTFFWLIFSKRKMTNLWRGPGIGFLTTLFSHFLFGPILLILYSGFHLTNMPIMDCPKLLFFLGLPSMLVGWITFPIGIIAGSILSEVFKLKA